MIQYETSDVMLGNINIAEAIDTRDDILFSESYVIAGAKLCAGKIYANYDLVVVGDLEAIEVEINGDLVVNGNIKAERVRCQRLTCTGRVHIDSLQCDEDLLAKFVSGNTVQVQGSLLASDTIIIDQKCEVERYVVAGEGISGEGWLSAQSTIVGEYMDFDGIVESNVYEIATMFSSAQKQQDSSSDSGKDFEIRLEKMLNEFYETIEPEEQDLILEKISKCAEVQKVSFAELSYLFYEIDRISYLDKIVNLRDYLLIKYTEKVFPQFLVEYETIEHVYSTLIKEADASEMDYSADDILQFAMSLKIVTTEFGEETDEYADKIFSSIGLKYSFVKKQFERA